LRIIDALNGRILIVTASVLIILGVYFYVTSNNYSSRFSDIQPTSSSPCAIDFISQVNCSPNQGQQNAQINGLINKGIALEQLGHLQDAIKYYDKALRLDPTDPDLLVRKGDALALVKNYSGAIIYYEITLARYPNSRGSTGLLWGIGHDLYQLGKYEEAIRYYDKALAREPNNVQIRHDKMLTVTALEKSRNKSYLAYVNRSAANN
jgi:tetratricopeptide (TPR) repeat protein